jgi:hypothetical protein
MVSREGATFAVAAFSAASGLDGSETWD